MVAMLFLFPMRGPTRDKTVQLTQGSSVLSPLVWAPLPEPLQLCWAVELGVLLPHVPFRAVTGALPLSVSREHGRGLCPIPTPEHRRPPAGSGPGPAAPLSARNHRRVPTARGDPGPRRPSLAPLRSRPDPAGPPVAPRLARPPCSHAELPGRGATCFPLPPDRNGAALGRRGEAAPGPTTPPWGRSVGNGSAATPSPRHRAHPPEPPPQAPGRRPVLTGTGAPRCPGNAQAEALSGAGHPRRK